MIAAETLLASLGAMSVAKAQPSAATPLPKNANVMSVTIRGVLSVKGGAEHDQHGQDHAGDGRDFPCGGEGDSLAQEEVGDESAQDAADETCKCGDGCDEGGLHDVQVPAADEVDRKPGDEEVGQGVDGILRPA
jgi:hypothetical protein